MVVTLAFDTETTGFVLAKEKPDHPGQPHLVELGCAVYDEDERERVTLNLIIKPDGWTVPSGASTVHGITTEMAHALGVPLVVALAAFSNLAKLATRHAGHNVDFDLKVMMAQFHRIGRPFPPMNPLCTKDLADPITRLPPTARMVSAGFGHKTKPPTLTECTKILFDEGLVGAHGALTDARACARVLFEIERRSRDAVRIPN